MRDTRDYWIALGIVFGILIVAVVVFVATGGIHFCGEACTRGGMP